MRIRTRAWKLGVASLWLALASAGFGPSGSDTKVTKEQLDYSKQMFGEGEAAMEAGDYALALQKFREGYRYAPHLHVFTYNIASAADAMGDCRTAQSYYQMFIDLVAEHPKRGEVGKRLEVLRTECQTDAETAQLDTTPTDAEDPTSGGAGKASREEREDQRVMNGALEELRAAQARYEAASARHPSIKAFKRAARAKKKHVKQLRKVALAEGVELEGDAVPSIEIPTDAKLACREAESQENRIIDAMAEVIERFDGNKTLKVASRIHRTADRRDRLAFDSCG